MSGQYSWNTACKWVRNTDHTVRGKVVIMWKNLTLSWIWTYAAVVCRIHVVLGSVRLYVRPIGCDSSSMRSCSSWHSRGHPTGRVSFSDVVRLSISFLLSTQSGCTEVQADVEVVRQLTWNIVFTDKYCAVCVSVMYFSWVEGGRIESG